MELNNPNYAPDIDFNVDPEHTGVRIVGCLTFFLCTMASFLILNTFIPNGGLLIVGLSLAIGVGLTYASDNILKHLWPSNRYLQIVDDVIRLTQKDNVQSEVDATQNVNLIMWHFQAPRHPRVPKGWYVVANALEQDGEYVVTYSIASPDDMKALPLSRLSVEYAKKKKDRNVEDSRDLRKAGHIRRIEQAEFFRGELGAEMTLEDYQAYLDHLVDTYTEWMPKDK